MEIDFIKRSKLSKITFWETIKSIEILNFLKKHNVRLDQNFSVIVKQGPGSFSGIRTSLAVDKGLEISKNMRLYGYKDTDLRAFDKENRYKLLDKNLKEKKLIKPIYLS